MVHILVTLIQMIGILVPLVGCGLLIRKAQNRVSMYLLMANFGCLITNGSYMLLLQAETYEGASIALKMEYFGNVIFYLLFALFLWEYMKLKRYKWAVAAFIFWCIFDAAFLFLIWTGDSLHLAFESLEFVRSERFGLVMIQAVSGFFYQMHYCIISAFIFLGMIYTMVKMFSVRLVSERNNLARLVGTQFVTWASLSLMLSFNFSFDIVSICASLSILAIVIGVYQGEFLGVAERGREWVFEQMEDAFIIVDKMYGYLDSNSYAQKIFAELRSRHKNETVSEELQELFMDKGKIQQIHGKHYNKKIIELEENGETVGYSLLLVDVTEQYELIERVREEKERANAASQAKSAFVSNVSHEIRTPMNAIVGMTQIMLRRNPPEQEREYLMNIQNSGNALLTIVNDLLDMSKIESGKMELVDEEYDLMSMLSDMGMIILNRIGNKPVELLFDIDTDIPARLYGDSLRIRQIIINLMNNATKFTEKGFVCLTVKIKQIHEDDIELFISVKDTGQGIRKEDIDKLFGSFQQVDTKKNHYKEGTGLGLSISKQFVEMMKGTIGVTSEYGKGSEFYFTIHQKIVEQRKAAQLSDGCEAVIVGNMKNKAVGEQLRRLVERLGLTYVTDAMTLEQTGLPVFYFTDQYESLGGDEKQKLDSMKAVICGMVNPMTDSECPKGIHTMNKPLYSYNFCHFIENRENQSRDIELNPLEDNREDIGEDKTEFLAPDACILIVDDNEINRMIAEEMLLPSQMQIETASDGSQALEMIQRKHYDLIFMDHLMPVIDGVEAARQLRKMDGEYYQKVPVIALTANTAKEQREEYIQAGMSDYLSKPIDMDEIYRIIRKWIPDKIQ